MDSVYKNFQESLNKVIKNIRNEIKKGSVESSIKLTQEGDTFSLITKLKGKAPNKQTWIIPQEDRDDHIALLKQLEELKKETPFVRLLQAIRSTRHLIHTDEVWKKNIISYFGDSYDLDDFLHLKKQDSANVKDILEKVKLAKHIQNARTESKEKNIALQSLYQTLILKDFMKHKDIQQYSTLSTLLSPTGLVHEIKKPDGDTMYIRDGEAVTGPIEKTYTSLKKYDTIRSRQMDEHIIGKVGTWDSYKRQMVDMGLTLYPSSAMLKEEMKYCVICNVNSSNSIGNGPYEAYIEDVKPFGGAHIRKMLTYDDLIGNLPIVLNGSLFTSKISAIMSYKTPTLTGLNDTTSLNDLWTQYMQEYKKGGQSRKQLLKQEKDVLLQNWDIRYSDVEILKEVASSVVVGSKYGDSIYFHHPGVYELVLKQPRFNNSESSRNQTILLEWILSNRDWVQEIRRTLGDLEDTTWASLLNAIQIVYSVNLQKQTLEDEIVKNAMTTWIDSKPVVWEKTLIKSIEDSGFESPQVTPLELESFLKDYGEAIWNELRRLPKYRSIDSRYSIAIILGIFMSILHPKYRDTQKTQLSIMDARNRDNLVLKVIIDKDDRDILREVMNRYSISYFELPVSKEDSLGAEERKEELEVDEMESDRKDETSTLTVIADRGMNIRL